LKSGILPVAHINWRCVLYHILLVLLFSQGLFIAMCWTVTKWPYLFNTCIIHQQYLPLIIILNLNMMPKQNYCMKIGPLKTWFWKTLELKAPTFRAMGGHATSLATLPLLFETILATTMIKKLNFYR
jgi:hypothetical protein